MWFVSCTQRSSSPQWILELAKRMHTISLGTQLAHFEGQTSISHAKHSMYHPLTPQVVCRSAAGRALLLLAASLWATEAAGASWRCAALPLRPSTLPAPPTCCCPCCPAGAVCTPSCCACCSSCTAGAVRTPPGCWTGCCAGCRVCCSACCVGCCWNCPPSGGARRWGVCGSSHRQSSS